MLYELSYANLALYNSVLPTYRSKKDAKGELGTKENPLRADDPKNNQLIRDIIKGYR